MEPDEASNPVDVCVLGPDAVVLKANLVSDTVRSRGESGRAVAVCSKVILGPPIEDKRVDSGTVYVGQTYDRWMIDALFSVMIRLATSR